jgi:hypothetical protein
MSCLPRDEQFGGKLMILVSKSLRLVNLQSIGTKSDHADAQSDDC